MSRKILFLTGWYPTENNLANGIFIREMAKAVSLYNNVVVLHTRGTNSSLPRWYLLNDRIDEDLRRVNLYYHKSPIPKTTYLLYLVSLYKAIKYISKNYFKPDVIHAHVYSSGFPAVLFGKYFGIKVVISEHYTGFPRGIVTGVELQKAKIAFRFADRVCPVSEGLKKSIIDTGLNGQMKVIPNVVDTNLFNLSSNLLQKKETKRILFVALLSSKKGVPVLLNSISKLLQRRNDFVLDIIGDGPDKTEYELYAEQLGLEKTVIFHGSKKKSGVACFMKNCDFFVLPSYFETFGVVIIEALATGKPVIVTDIAGPRDIVTKDVGLKVSPGDENKLSEAIDYMLDNYIYYNSEKIAEYARTYYSYEAVGKLFNEVYHDVLETETH